ncbi:DUF1015 family protein, partial [Elusimicrobiota bacterium]
YDFKLMQDSGHVTGFQIDDPGLIEGIVEGLERLAGESDLLYAVGDGNHSLAAAKGVWEEIKRAGGDDVMDHPARFALVELESIYDEGLEFEAIHRVLFNVDQQDLLQRLKSEFDCEIEKVDSRDGILRGYREPSEHHRMGFMAGDKLAVVTIKKPEVELTAEVLQGFLDRYLKDHKDASIDYVHGDQPVMDLATKPGNLGFFLLSVKKADFFATIRRRGSYPRKTFSMGEADEKRFYIESRKIVR